MFVRRQPQGTDKSSTLAVPVGAARMSGLILGEKPVDKRIKAAQFSGIRLSASRVSALEGAERALADVAAVIEALNGDESISFD